MAKAVTRVKKSRTLVPASLAEAEALVEKIGQNQSEINAIQQGLKREIAELQEKAKKLLGPLKIDRDSQISALFAFANARKDQLTEETRSVELASGTFGWRWTPPRVETSTSDEETVNRLKAAGSRAFIRVRERVNRQMLLRERPDIDGIDFSQNDEFFVIPKQASRKTKTVTEAIDR